MSGPSVEIFQGVKVVELAQWVFVPVAGALLADWGAEVVKIEHPVSGDGYRGLVSQGMIHSTGGLNHSMEMANRGKRSLGLDVKSPEGREILLRLIADADVFLTNYLPSVLTKLGLTVEELREVNPRLIYARGHGFGVRGPDADKGAYDSTAFWSRGAVGVTLTPSDLERPIGQRGAFGDRNGGVQLAFGIASALFRRERTGEPSVVDVSLLATAMWTMASDIISSLQGAFGGGAGPSQPDTRDQLSNPLTALYPTKDGRWLMMSCLQADKWWPDVCRAIGRPDLRDDPRFAGMAARAEHRGELVALLDDVFRTKTLPEWNDLFADERFPWAPCQNIPELIEDRQVAANGYLGVVHVEDGDDFRLPTGAVQFDEQPTALRRGPEHGQDTEDILLGLGMDWAEIAKLQDAGVIP